MQISPVTNNSFKARVESPSPLVGGDWQYITDKSAQNNAIKPKKKGSLLKKVLIAVGALAVATAAFVGIRKLDAIKTVMEKGGFAQLETLGDKAKWVIGKIGDGANWLKGMTWDKVAKLFTKNANKVAETIE